MSTAHAQRWTTADLPWDRFDASAVDPELLKIVKAASLVEYNANDYATYLSRVFSGDSDFVREIPGWAEEETQHGAALGAWAERADPTFNFKEAFARYRAGFGIDVNAEASIRGSRMGELIARCAVETGTNSYYAALGNATNEPVLKALCRLISADEARHYKFFYRHLERYLDKEKAGRLERLKIGLGRVKESEDDELAFAFFAANAPADAVYNRPYYTSAYMACAYPLYKLDHLDHMVALLARACGFKVSGGWRRPFSLVAREILRVKLRKAKTHIRRETPIFS